MESEITSHIKRKSQFIGTDALVQALGIVFFLGFVFWGGMAGGIIGFIVMLLLLLIGSRMALYYACANCGNRLNDKQVKICPICKAHFG